MNEHTSLVGFNFRKNLCFEVEFYGNMRLIGWYSDRNSGYKLTNLQEKHYLPLQLHFFNGLTAAFKADSMHRKAVMGKL